VETRMQTQARLPLLALLSGIGLAAAAQPTHWVLQMIALLGVVVLPGAALSHAIGTDRGSRAANLVVATGYGITVLMSIGWLTSLLLEEGAYQRGTQIGIYAVLLTAGVIYERVRGTDALAGIVGERPERALGAFAVALALPAATLIAVERLDRGNGSGAALTMFVLAALLLAGTVLAGATKVGERHPGAVLLGLYSCALSAVWGTATRGQHLFGWDIQKEYSVAAETLVRGYWQAPADQDAYASMLSITSMPAQLHSIADISVQGTLSLLYPLLLAMLPVAAFEIVRRHASVRAATLATAGFIVAARAFPRQLPAIGRQEVALMLFAAGMLLATNRTMNRTSRRIGVAILLGATAFSHYTTAYVTLGMVAAAGATTWFITRKDRSERADVTFNWKTVAVIGVAVLGWNLVIAPTGGLVENPSQQVQSDGLQVLPGQRDENQTLWEAWLEGSSAIKYGSPDDYARELSMLRDNRLAWMDIDVHLGDVEPVEARATQVEGPLENFRGAWGLVSSVSGQLMVLLLTLGALRCLTRRRWKADGLPADLVGLIAGAFVLNVLLRISGTASGFYNPERGALHNAVILAVPAAILIDRLAKRSALTFAANIGVALTFAVGTWGVAPYLFGGSPPAATAEYGEDSERFLVSPAELSTARWLATELDEKDLLQGDRYAQVILLNVDRTSEHGKVFIMHPDFIDYGAYIFSTRANTIEKRARGLENRQFAIFTSPTDGFSELRATVYATEETRVLK